MNKIEKFFDDKSASWDKREIKSNEYFKEFVNSLMLEEGMRVIDLGCGTGIITSLINDITNSFVLGMDLSNSMIEIANKKNNNPKIRFVHEDFYKSNYKDYDAIVCHNAYPHFLDKALFKNKALCTLKKGGLLIICHSISKDEVNTRHKNLDENISSPLNEVMDEAKIYLDSFKLIKASDTKDEYILILKKVL